MGIFGRYFFEGVFLRENGVRRRLVWAIRGRLGVGVALELFILSKEYGFFFLY